jgi:hypothetical protein
LLRFLVRTIPFAIVRACNATATVSSTSGGHTRTNFCRAIDHWICIPSSLLEIPSALPDIPILIAATAEYAKLK